ncbi:GDP-mannose 4,6 dehydratase-like protein 3 [Elsinoe fawcettii]|nr:GDP-mannose 4,6 dehydratase-like protein 3 [Elsinoe fawcettii]
MPFVENPEEEFLLPYQHIWQEAPLLLGQSRFESNPDIRCIMITGAAGFIGSWIARHLTITYPMYHIVSFDKLDYCATLHNHAQLADRPNFSFYKGDITDAEDVLGCLRKHRVDAIMHFAAQSHVDLSFGNSIQFTITNALGTHVVLECVQKYGGIRKFIHVSTDEVYGEVRDDQDDLFEDALLEPTNPYAASKAAAEQQIHAFRKSFGLPAIIVRSNNVYGPHQYPEKVIPKFALLLQRGKQLTLHGSGKNTRRYLYAGDAADAFDTILHRGQIGTIYNVGSRDEVSNLGLCTKLLEHFGHETEGPQRDKHIVHVQDRPFNDHRYAVDGSKLKKLGWQQKTSFEDGLRITVDWYKRFGSEWWGDIESRLTPFPEPPSPLAIEEKQQHELLQFEAPVGMGASKDDSIWNLSTWWSGLFAVEA